LAPAFLKQDFNKVSAQDYLAWISPPSRTEYNISAIVASDQQRDILAFEGDNDGACLQVVTRQWCGKQLLSLSIAVNPSADYHLGYDVMAPVKGKSRLTNP
jgi:GntR family histidine utilization transcriptional repressor